MAALTDTQKRALDRLKKAISNHVAKPTEETKQVVLRQYDSALRHTLGPDSLTKEEVAALRSVTNPAEEAP